MTFDRFHYRQAAIYSLQSQGRDPWETLGHKPDGSELQAWEKEAHEIYLLRVRLDALHDLGPLGGLT